MTYVQTSARRRYHRRAHLAAPRPLSGFFDFFDDLAAAATGGLISGDDIRDARAASCAEDADSSVGSMAVQINELERTWNPTGFFTADEMVKVIGTTIQYANAARDQMMSALSNVDIRASGKEASAREFDKANDDLNTQQDKGDIFIAAVNKARQTGTRAIDAPGLKLWVVAVMKASQGLARAAAFINCNKSLFERFVRAVNAALDRAIEIIKKVVGIVLAAGEAAIGVVGDFAGLMLKILKFAPYLLIAGGGFYLYKQYRQSRE